MVGKHLEPGDLEDPGLPSRFHGSEGLSKQHLADEINRAFGERTEYVNGLSPAKTTVASTEELRFFRVRPVNGTVYRDASFRVGPMCQLNFELTTRTLSLDGRSLVPLLAFGVVLPHEIWFWGLDRDSRDPHAFCVKPDGVLRVLGEFGRNRSIVGCVCFPVYSFRGNPST